MCLSSVHMCNPQQISRHFEGFDIQIVHISFQNPLSTIKFYFSKCKGKVSKNVNIFSLRISEKPWIIIFISKYSQCVFLAVCITLPFPTGIITSEFTGKYSWYQAFPFIKNDGKIEDKAGWEECSFDVRSYFSYEVLRTRLWKIDKSTECILSASTYNPQKYKYI